MRKLPTCIGLITAFAAVFIGGAAFADDFAVEAQALLERSVEENELVGLTTAISLNGEIVWTGAAGYADLEAKIPAKPEMIHRIASITKSMTATAIMQLVAGGKIDLDAPLQTYIPGYPTKEKGPILIRHLLTHTSGTRHYFGAERRPTTHYASLSDALEVFKNDRVPFEPGTRYRYTTYGYTVLGAVIEAVTGQTYGEYMTAKIWDPAGMTHTSLEVHGEKVPNKSRLYVKDEEGIAQEDQYTDLSVKYPGGGVQCTAEDLVRFAIAFENATLLSPEFREPMFDAPDVRGRPRGLNYGFGWMYGESETLGVYINNDGGQAGTSTYLAIFRDHDIAVSGVANLYNEGRAVQQTCIDLVKLVLARR